MIDITAKRRGLGQGLAALFDDLESRPDQNTEASLGDEQEIVFLNPKQLETGHYQPRKHFDEASLEELSDSIKEQGILHPLVARKAEDGTIELIAGERRLRAAIKANLQAVPCRILPLTKGQALEISLLENIQRSDLSAIEEAAGYQRLIDEMTYTQEKLAQKVGKSRAHIANMLRLLKLPQDIQAAIEAGKLSAGHGRALVGHPQSEALGQKAIKEGWSVRQMEEAASSGLQPLAGAMKAVSAPSLKESAAEERSLREEEALAQQLTSLLNLPVHIGLKRKGGDIRIRFQNAGELDRLLQKLTEAFSEAPAPLEASREEWQSEEVINLDDARLQKALQEA